MKGLLKELFFDCDTITSIKRILGVIIGIVTFIVMASIETYGFVNCLLILCASVFLWRVCGISDAYKD